MTYLSQLQDAVPSAANLSYYLEIVREKYLLRKMITTCTDVVGRVYDYEGEVDALWTRWSGTCCGSARPGGRAP